MPEIAIKKQLMRELKSIYDNKDFVCGTVSIAGNAENWSKILEYINLLREEGQEIKSDNILLLALNLSRDNNKQESIASVARKVSVAML